MNRWLLPAVLSLVAHAAVMLTLSASVVTDIVCAAVRLTPVASALAMLIEYFMPGM